MASTRCHVHVTDTSDRPIGRTVEPGSAPGHFPTPVVTVTWVGHFLWVGLGSLLRANDSVGCRIRSWSERAGAMPEWELSGETVRKTFQNHVITCKTRVVDPSRPTQRVGFPNSTESFARRPRTPCRSPCCKHTAQESIKKCVPLYINEVKSLPRSFQDRRGPDFLTSLLPFSFRPTVGGDSTARSFRIGAWSPTW